MIEMIVTILCLSVIASLSYNGYNYFMRRQYEEELVRLLKNFEAAQEIYKAKYGTYYIPPNSDVLEEYERYTLYSNDDITTNPSPHADMLVSAVESLHKTLESMGSSDPNHLYIFHEDGQSYEFTLYNGPGYNDMGTDSIIVNHYWYTKSICCAGTKCLTLNRCQYLLL